ncbi:Nitrate regulatory protein [Carnimonas sp. R-84981]|uniref:nitrate- and nitrite sensing domain-containing protein n=1 Tax=Carnimonas bestiolae TaxID=3402172 RepID=UPI003EDC4EA4
MNLTALDFVLASKKSEIADLQQLLQMGKLVGAISQLIHLLQQERGTANIYLCCQEDGWCDLLREKIQYAQHAEQTINQQLETLDLTSAGLPNSSRLFSRIAAVLHRLTTMPSLRQHIQTLEVSRSHAMNHYCEIIRTQLALIFEIVDTSGDPSISQALLALFSFMQGKELAGQERALVAAGFAAQRFDASDRQHIIELIEAQERCFQTFSEFADERSLALWQRYLTQTGGEFERLRRIACTGTSASNEPSITAVRWFELTTSRIDNMKTLEDALETVLMECCRQRIDSAEASLEQQEQEIDQMLPHDSDYAALVSPKLSRSVLELVEHQAQRLQMQEEELATLRETLAERKLIERAKGLLMQHHGMTEPQAHKALQNLAMAQNKKLAEIAQAMLEVGTLLEKPTH